jgi:hypothetical protein
MLGSSVAASTSQLTMLARDAMTHSMLATQKILVAEDSGTTLNSSGIVTFIVTKIVPILLAVVGVIILSRSGRGRWSEALTTGGIALLGVMFIAGAGALFVFGGSVAKLAFGG